MIVLTISFYIMRTLIYSNRSFANIENYSFKTVYHFVNNDEMVSTRLRVKMLFCPNLNKTLIFQINKFRALSVVEICSKCYTYLPLVLAKIFN